MQSQNQKEIREFLEKEGAKVFVGNVSFKSTKESLEGVIGDMVGKECEVLMGARGRFAFVRVEGVEVGQVLEVVAGAEIDGRRVSARKAVVKSEEELLREREERDAKRASRGDKSVRGDRGVRDKVEGEGEGEKKRERKKREKRYFTY